MDIAVSVVVTATLYWGVQLWLRRSPKAKRQALLWKALEKEAPGGGGENALLAAFAVNFLLAILLLFFFSVPQGISFATWICALALWVAYTIIRFLRVKSAYSAHRRTQLFGQLPMIRITAADIDALELRAQ